MNRNFDVRLLAVRRLINRINPEQIQRSVNAQLREEMCAYFQHDVSLLRQLLEQYLFEPHGWEENERPTGRDGRNRSEVQQ